jgi:hypothetical protein
MAVALSFHRVATVLTLLFLPALLRAAWFGVKKRGQPADSAGRDQ